MNEIVRRKLIEVARKKGEQTITYQELSDQCNLGLLMRESEYARAEIGRILGEISTFEHNNARPLLSSLVLSKGSAYEGDGFFKLCDELGFGPWKKLQNDIEFPFQQMRKCYDFWKNDSYYDQYLNE
ncbi:MAG: hypothetical protein Q8S11_14750 [Daejeonella sp.]|uniref:hypothetical protein n=1 Tax=Daejeonella sp. TaxID=2805397 RepID=UPI00273496C3|nr:hypothetical protein [Daejeonella sp.]MDP3469596.1 hypothetical protein [Daejeonella sp.]